MDKLFRYKLSDAEFVSGEESLCFEDVVKDFSNASYINILTFNISTKEVELMDAVRTAGIRGIPIKIITNIPGRWNTYYSEYRKKDARNKIEIYERKLNPASIGKLASVFFKFNNHGKILMTDNIIYWGSANFSDESKKNYECGTISRDKKFIEYVNTVIIPEVLKESTSYYATEYNICIMSMYSAIACIHNMYEEIHDASFGYYEDYRKEIEYFDFYNNYINWSMLEELMETIRDFESIIQDLVDDLDSSELEADENKLEELVEDYDEYINIANDKIVDLCYEIEELARFDSSQYTSDLLSEEYAREADNEHLEECVESAMADSNEVYIDLIESSEVNIKELLQLLSEYEDTLLRFIDDIFRLAKVNEEIDNTK